MDGSEGKGEHDGERGLALVSVLWAVSILSLIATSVVATSTLSRHLARNETRAFAARMTMDAVLNRAVLGLIDPRVEQRWRVDGVPRSFRFGDEVTTVAIEDELGKIDLNVANDDLISGLIHAAGLASAEADKLADRILDWRSPDGTKRLNGAVAADYEMAGLGYRPRGGPFQSTDELKLVPGMTPELYDKIQPAITVQSKRSAIDPSVAPELALKALPGMDELRVKEILDVRNSTVRAETNRRPGVLDPAIALNGRVFTVRINLDYSGWIITRRDTVLLTGEAVRPFVILAEDR